MSCTECIPQRESAVVCPSVSLMYLLVRAIILAIHIAIDGRSNHAMIKGCIEIHTVIVRTTLNFDTLQLLVPVSLGLSQILVEIIMRSFCIQVLHSTFHADTRESGYNRNLFAFCRIEHETGDIRCTHLFTFQLDFGIIQLHALERTRETSGKINLLSTCPTFRETITTDVARIHHFDM